MKVPTIRLAGITAPAAPRKVADKWPSLLSQQNRRITGVTPRAVGSYPENPARLLPKSKAFRSLAGATKKKIKGGM